MVEFGKQLPLGAERVGVLRVELGGLRECVEGVGLFPLGLQAEPKPVPGVCKSPVEPDGFAEGLDAVGEPVLVEVRAPEFEPRGSVVRGELRKRAPRRDRLVPALEAGERPGADTHGLHAVALEF